MVQTLTGQQRIARCLPTAGSPGLGQPLPSPWRPGRARCTHPRKSHLYAAIPGLLPSRPREPSLPGQCERSDHRESTDTRQLIEVKPYRARLVLRWVTTLESRVALSFLFAIFAIFFAPLLLAHGQRLRACMPKRSRKSGRTALKLVIGRLPRSAPTGFGRRHGLRAKPWAREAWRRTSAQSKFRCLGVGVHARPHRCRRGGSSSHGCSRRMRWR